MTGGGQPTTGDDGFDIFRYGRDLVELNGDLIEALKAEKARADALAAENERLQGLLGDNFLNNRIGWARMAKEAQTRIDNALTYAHERELYDLADILRGALRSWADGARVDIEGLTTARDQAVTATDRLRALRDESDQLALKLAGEIDQLRADRNNLNDNYHRVNDLLIAADARIAAALAICDRVGIGFPSRALAESVAAALSGSPAVDGDTA